tara:strand:+ start:192 stop:413 length:222 start_codon:yes stop_codon:yes gene_type:complete
MTIDKIKHYMNPVIFNYWCSVNDADVIKKAATRLQYELEEKLLEGVEHYAELYLLKHKLGIPRSKNVYIPVKV